MFFGKFPVLRRPFGFIQVNGPDSKKFLQGLCTNDISGKFPLATSFLSTKSRIIADTTVFTNTFQQQQQSDSLFVEVHLDLVSDLINHLSMYKLRAKVDISDVSKNFSSFMVMDNEIEKYDMSVNDQKVISLMDPRIEGFKNRVVIQNENLNILTESKSSPTNYYEKYRLLNGIAEGNELKNRIPFEMNLDLLNNISLKKGCYIGQELIARTIFKGQIRKRLVPFFLKSHLSSEEFDLFNDFKKLPDPLFQRLINFNDLFEKQSSKENNMLGSKVISNNEEEVGEVISFDEKTKVGLAIMKLESLYSNKGSFSFHLIQSDNVQNEKISIIPFQTNWWPEIDLTNGKKKV